MVEIIFAIHVRSAASIETAPYPPDMRSKCGAAKVQLDPDAPAKYAVSYV